ncbi:hypothetical protein PGTUg99_017103 [Puccinia graminis f. sp. tritici]|uniref:Uncharacterized protein n=1 Tax=Puccinia graminis f. sp. tritici TaxID=56615 RepID=A0A5B0PMW1_PUCGR|nr:hypothetical protein PGTUg99_017103 [Puccinia graminis f. sp. tritici]
MNLCAIVVLCIVSGLFSLVLHAQEGSDLCPHCEKAFGKLCTPEQMTWFGLSDEGECGCKFYGSGKACKKIVPKENFICPNCWTVYRVNPGYTVRNQGRPCNHPVREIIYIYKGGIPVQDSSDQGPSEPGPSQPNPKPHLHNFFK